MGIWTVLLDVIVLLGAGALAGALFEAARQSAIVGYIIAGAVLGPNVLHLIQSNEEVLAISELGVALLLFVIGLEFSWSRLRRMGWTALGSGIAQVGLSATIGAGLSALFGVSFGAAFCLGAIIALSSTACVLRVLASRGEIESVHGERCLGVLLVQDMAVVPLVLIVTVFADSGSPQEIALDVLRTVGIGAGLVLALLLIFRFFVPRLLSIRAVYSNRELPLLFAVVSGLGSTIAAHEAGVSPALGAFVAGMVLAESPFAFQVHAEVSGLKTLLLTLFFTAMGMLIDPLWIANHALEVGGFVLAVVLGKTAITWLALRLFRTRGQTALATGIALAQIGEFSFVLASLARGSLFGDSTFLLVVSGVVLTMACTPYLVAAAPRIAARFGWNGLRQPDEVEEEDAVGIVVGFGPAGRAASERLAEHGCRVVVVDLNPASVQDAHRLGYAAVTGDARYEEVLDYAGLKRAIFVVVTVPGTEAALEIVRSVRRRAPSTWLLVRARFHRALAELQSAGAHVVVDEEHEIGRRIAEAYQEQLMVASTKPTSTLGRAPV